MDNGAQLMLVDAHGNQTGYDPTTGRMLQNISGAVYTNDSITDATDGSDDAAEAEVRLLRVQATAGDTYQLHVLPTDRNSYRIEFRCRTTANGSARIRGKEVGIAPGEQHIFVLHADNSCSNQFVAGAFASRSGQSAPLLSYAFPTSDNIKLPNTKSSRIVIVYSQEISATSFVATLNGQVITQMFHPSPGTIEAVALPVNSGKNIVQLSVTGAQDASNKVMDTFTINVE